MNKITYEPIIDNFVSIYSIEDLRKLYVKLRPLFAEDEQEVKVIQIKDE